MRFVYVGVPYAVWELIKSTDGTLVTPIHFEHDNPGMLDWVKDAMRHRTGIDTITPIYCHVTSKDAERWWSNTPKVAVLKVRVPDAHVLEFDNTAFVSALNGPLNATNPRGVVAWSKSEFDDSMVSREQGIASCDRMFDFENPARDRRWCGRPIVRALIPELSRVAVRGVKVFCYGRRLRKNMRRLSRRARRL